MIFIISFALLPKRTLELYWLVWLGRQLSEVLIVSTLVPRLLTYRGELVCMRVNFHHTDGDPFCLSLCKPCAHKCYCMRMCVVVLTVNLRVQE